jgi:hypothetical protein
MTADISRMIVAGQKEIFNKNFDAFPLEYPAFTTEKTTQKQTETYDSMGNLKAAAVKVEGDAIQYGKVGQAYQTSITNETVANGYEVTLEATKYDLYGQVNSIKAKELARTMREYEEGKAIRWIDGALTINLADGVPLASAAHPLVNSASLNDTLATAATLTDPDNHKTMIKKFANFKNHAGGPMKSKPTDGLTHAENMMDIEEIYGSANKANEMSNTKNSLPKISWHYSTYMSSKTAWHMWDSQYEHILMQWFEKTQFDSDEDKISTKNLFLNAIAMYNSGCLPNIGWVSNAGA